MSPMVVGQEPSPPLAVKNDWAAKVGQTETVTIHRMHSPKFNLFQVGYQAG